MDYWGAQQWQLPPSQSNSQNQSNAPPDRRPLAINDMLNHGPPPPSGYEYGRLPRQLSHFHPGLAPPPPPPPQPNSYYQSPYYPSSGLFHDRRGPQLSIQPPQPMNMYQGWGNMSHSMPASASVPRPLHLRHPIPPPHAFQAQEDPNSMEPWGSSRPKVCVLCLEKFAGEDPRSQFPHQCIKCAGGDFCAKCLKEWFIDACRNESKMPPKCCSVVPLAAVKHLLDRSQMELYKAKYEEWSTTDRLYCPVPRCSAFIPPRLYNTLQPGPFSYRREPQIPNTFRKYTQSDKLKNEILPHVGCPTCGVSVCTMCRKFSHIGPCTENDLEPDLEEQLKKWKIKRCPKCRAGLRKMYGCSHVECRCGAHFCWECLLPINQCRGNCDDSGSDEEFEELEAEEGDLDGRARFHDGAGPDFGPEPANSNVIDAWGCRHVWLPISQASVRLVTGRPLECNRCFRSVGPLVKEKGPVPKDEDTEMSGMTPTAPRNTYGELAWQCFSGHLMCYQCPKQAPPHRQDDPTRLWMCECERVCHRCDKNEAMQNYAMDQQHAREQKEQEDSTAWECRCGMIRCGACKDLPEHS